MESGVSVDLLLYESSGEYRLVEPTSYFPSGQMVGVGCPRRTTNRRRTTAELPHAGTACSGPTGPAHHQPSEHQEVEETEDEGATAQPAAELEGTTGPENAAKWQRKLEGQRGR